MISRAAASGVVAAVALVGLPLLGVVALSLAGLVTFGPGAGLVTFVVATTGLLVRLSRLT